MTDIRHHHARDLDGILPELGRLYGSVYREAPYGEGPDDVAAFLDAMPWRAAQPGFRLVVASDGGPAIGFGFGHQLTAGTRWWLGATTPLPAPVVQEYPGRTFALIELAVLAGHRRRGIARAMHDALLAGAPEQRSTLLVRPQAQPARTAYARWGYTPLALVRPGPRAPLYQVLVLPLD